MLRMVENCVYKQVVRPGDKLVVGTKILYKRKIGQDGKVEKYKGRLVAKGFWQVGGVYYTGKYSPTPATASIRMLLAMTAAKDGELRHYDAEQAFVKVDVDEEIYIEIPEAFQEFPGAVRRLNKAIYGFVQAGRGWNKFCDNMTAIGFEQAKEDPCVFLWVVDGEAEMVVVVHVDDILAHGKDQATMDRFAAEPGQKTKLKDMGDAEYGITYGGQGCGLCMEAYTDSDFGACLDTRRSVSGAVLMLAKGAISWHSRIEEVTALGASEAEYVALSEVVKEVIFLRQVQEFMEPSMRVGAVNVFEGNEGAIKLATNKHASRRTTHIDVKHHLVRDASDARKVRVAYVRSGDQHADLLTKPLDMQTFYKHAKLILNVV